MNCIICQKLPATHRARYDTPNGRADNDLCLGCLAGRLAAYPQNPMTTPRDFQEFEIMPIPTDEEMEELIASKDWPTYWLEMHECRKSNHKKCKGRKQPTSHIDPHPTVCTCDCHEDPDGQRAAHRVALQGYPDNPGEEDDFVFGDDDDDEELIWTDEDEEDLEEDDDEFWVPTNAEAAGDEDDWEDDEDWDF